MNFKHLETEEKLRGGYYTSPEIVAFLERWVSVIQPRRILEPSAGDGAFLRPLVDHCETVEHVTAVEFLGPEAEKCRRAVEQLPGVSSEIVESDFLAWALRHSMRPGTYDAVVGNPPFIRYQYLDEAIQDRASRLFELSNLKFTRHTNAWVPFVIGSVRLLKPGGRLGMVVPAEIIHVLHAHPLRQFLAEQCSRIQLIDPRELWFEDALQGAMLLLAEKKESSEHTKGVAITEARDQSILSDDPERVFQDADYTNGKMIQGKWTYGLLTAQERSLLAGIEESGLARRFIDLASVDVGIVTGANKFFLVPDAIVEQFELRRWTSPMFGRSSHAPGVIYDVVQHEANRQQGLPTNLVWFGENEPEPTGPALDYIKKGEDEGLHERYKCRVRSPWYRVPSVYSTPVGMLKRAHDFPRLIRNRLGAYTTDTAYRITTQDISPDSLVSGFVNSLTALSAELEGRHYGGGVLELVPSEIERLLVVEGSGTSQGLEILDQMIRDSAPAEEVLTSRDQVVLAPEIGEKERTTLRGAWARLRDRRQRSD